MHTHPMLKTFLELSFDRASDPFVFLILRIAAQSQEVIGKLDVILAECPFSQMPSPPLPCVEG